MSILENIRLTLLAHPGVLLLAPVMLVLAFYFYSVPNVLTVILLQNYE
jgi:hypothetical protein